MEKCTAQLANSNQELDMVTARVDALKEKIKTQDLSGDVVRKTKSEQTQLVESMDRVSALKQQHREK